MKRVGYFAALLCCGWMLAMVPQPADAQTSQSNTAKPAASKSTAKAKPKAAQPKRKPVASNKNTSKKNTRKAKTARKAQPAAQPDRFSALVVDANTGHVLYEKNADRMRYPASLTKMMTLYLTFDALKKGKLTMSQNLPVSKKAAAQPQTNISLDEGDRLPVKTAIESLVVRSANDASMVLAEAIGGTQWNFALLMTQKARQLGMKNTVFRNPNGLPDPQQHTTAYDMARLGIALRRDFPEYFHYFSKREFSYNGITYPTHNRVMERFSGADGIKTGYIRASGFNLVTSVKRGNHYIVAVVMGGNTANSRDNIMVSMLERTFAQLEQKNRSVAGKEKAGLDDVDVANDNSAPETQLAQGH
jgi:D-alanyl-D-alanine carboxypeptidase